MMSALGQTQTRAVQHLMSARGQKRTCAPKQKDRLAAVSPKMP